MKASLTLLLALCTSLQSAVIFNEATSGDLSGDPSAPTMTMVTLGANTIIGQIGNNGNTGATNGNDADYIFFELGAGFEITELTIDAYSASPGNPGSSFLGHVAANQFAGQTSGDIDGSALINASSGDVLPSITGGGNLTAGNHAFWIQETSANTVDYQITFNVIPEPSSTALCLLGITVLLARRRKSVSC